MARKARKSRRRNNSRRRGGRARKPDARSARGSVERTRIIGDLPPLPTATRLLDQMRRRVGDEDFIWQRGLKYAEDARVAYLKIRGEQVEAGVKGSRRYLVSVTWPPGAPERFEGRCTCPYARKSTCKHMVAMAMTLWFATQHQEEEEANAELQAAADPLMKVRDLGPGSDARRPRNGRIAGSAVPMWLAALLDDESASPPPSDLPLPPLSPDQSWVLYDLLPGGGDPMPIEVRMAKMGPGMRPTRGRRLYELDPAAVQDLAKEAQVLPEDHLALATLSERGRAGAEPPPWPPGSLDRLLRLLARAREVRVQGEPVRVDPTPLDLVLVAAESKSGGVRFWVECRDAPRGDGAKPDPGAAKETATAPDTAGRKEPPARREPPKEGAIPGLRHYIPASPAWVHRVDGTLRPLTHEGTRLLRTVGPLSHDRLPEVPPEELERFREREWPLLASRYPMDIATDKLPRVIAPAPEARLYLIEPSEMTLEVRPAFAYVLPGDEVIEVGPQSPHFLRSESETGVTVQRNPDTEAELLAEVLKSVAHARGIEPTELDPSTDPWGIVLEGEDALAFLAEQAPRLEERFVIYGDESLQRLKVSRSGLEASVRVKSHMDWFDLKMGFSSGEGLASAAEVLRAWRKQKRFVRLNNGSYARIPEQWLERYGVLVEEAESARRDTKNKLPRYLASLGVALEDAVDSFEGDDRFKSWKNLLANPEHLPEVPIPKSLDATLRPYQEHGFSWLCWLSDQGFGGCLADDMGLGKTVQMLSYMLREKEAKSAGGKPMLVVAPTSVLFNWKQEAARFCPKLRTCIYQGANRRDLWSPEMRRQPDVVITSYPVLRIDAEILCSKEWHAAILDESQHIKNAESQTALAAFRLKATHRFVMTGTPLENRLDDLWSQYHFVMPGFLGRRRYFLQNYALRPGPQITAEVLETRLGKLRDRIHPFLLRRLKQDVASELPSRTEMVLHVALSAAEEKVYATVRDAYRAQVFSAIEEKGTGAARLTILEALLRLRQAACHPSLLPFDEARALGAKEGSSKVRELVGTLEEITAEGHKALVFSQWTSFLDIVEEDLHRAKIDTIRLDGSTKDRESVVQRFQSEDGPPVFLLSLKAGGTGLNLTAADYVIHLDPWWNPQVEAQANDRAHRIGQTRPVVVIKLVTAGTVEEKVVQLQNQKRALFEATVSAGKPLQEILGSEDMLDLLQTGHAVGDATLSSRKGRDEADSAGDDEAPPPGPAEPALRPDLTRHVHRRRGTARDNGKRTKTRAPSTPKNGESPAGEVAGDAREQMRAAATPGANGEGRIVGSGDEVLDGVLGVIRGSTRGVTTREVQQELDISSDMALLALRALMSRGLVVRTGRGASIRYLAP